MAKIVEINFQKLKDAKEAKNLSSYKIAAADGTIRQETVAKIIKGRHTPTATNLKRICNVLGIPIQDAFIERAA